MKKGVLLFLVLAVFLGCHDVKMPEEPENLLSKDQMVHILLDLALVNSAKGVNKKMLENNGIVPDQYIYKKYQIDSLQFAENNNYYAYRVDDYDEIIQKVMDSLDVIRKGLSEDMKKEEESMRGIGKSDSVTGAKRIKPVTNDSLNQLRGINDRVENKGLERVDSLIVD
ncbi:DUF4296 domain-containing protein [Mangrovimonas sp. AS39]|uniref:DUF4296 domain-containing protein n=1 Tax=Mangrovimonas futianensis TaxID=2895523 RepID=UPI001E3D382D|nr:DUF4296 domain-containing protein [Mangrovimonas futianensis]MCF1191082.1 DUF4296 domain-containing protein [Mangrovimonas futianensis]MCF1194777.1 DUF4296 domain-containing protein [Mangrovimonas futianensis]